MRISGSLFPGGIKTKGFSAVLAGGVLSSSVGAIASIVPRRGCFVVDLSSSMVRQTHSGDAEFAYFLRELNLSEIRRSRSGSALQNHYTMNVGPICRRPGQELLLQTCITRTTTGTS